jgi:hypothetical protein
MVEPGRSDRGRESSHRPLHAPAGDVGGTTIKIVPQPERILQATPALSNCPDCSASLAVLRIIPGRGGAEYWTMRCTRCGGIHLDIVKGGRDKADNDRCV